MLVLRKLPWIVFEKKSAKRSKIITQQTKTIENPDITDIKSLTIKHLKTSHKLSKTISMAEKASQVSGADKSSSCPLYSEKKKATFLMKQRL